MKGTTYRDKNGSWTGTFTITRAGTRRTFKRRGFERKADATEWLNAALAEHQRGERIEPSRATVREYLTDVWLPNVKRKPTTQRGYNDICKNRIIPHLGDVKLRDLTSGDIAALYATLRRSGRLNGKRGGLSETSIRHTHSVLHRALEHAVEMGLLRRNPARTLPRDTRPINTYSHVTPSMQDDAAAKLGALVFGGGA